MKDFNSQLTTEYALFSDATRGGKGIRGRLVKLGYRIAGGNEDGEIEKIASAFEMLHASLLIHDDVIDKGLTRRGKPTVYKALGENHYAVSQAICLGDMGFFTATKMIAESGFGSELKARVLSLFSDIMIDTIRGEMLDVKLSLPGQEKLEEDVLTIHKLKTAYYTVVGPLTIGAMLGGADESQLRLLRRFGENIGMAFQIQDDILGVFGDEREIGKSTTSDIEENKNTLLITYALEKATTAQRKILTRYYGKRLTDTPGLS
jgi:geranylgeranyl pyrophosphate synthase